MTRWILCLTASILLTGCNKYEALDATIPSCGYVRTTDLPYGNEPRQKLDIYRPRRVAPGAKVVIFFYGGAWQGGRKADYRFAAEGLTSEGFVAVVPDYRVYPEVTFPAFVEDGALAVRWVHDHVDQFGGDPEHIYLMGHSSGAHIAALLTLDEHYLKNVGVNRNVVQATVAMSGPYDFKIGRDSRPAFGKSENNSTIDPKTQPITYADGRAPPILLQHGAQDDAIAPGNAVRLAERIQAAGGQAKCIIYPKLGHAGVAMSLSFTFRWLAPVLHDAAIFFREH